MIMMQINMRVPTAIILLFLTCQSAAMADSAVAVESPWIREAPPTSTVLAAYMVLINGDDTPRTITRIDSPDFSNSQIHRTVVEDGIAKMVPVEQLPLPAGGTVADCIADHADDIEVFNAIDQAMKPTADPDYSDGLAHVTVGIPLQTVWNLLAGLSSTGQP